MMGVGLRGGNHGEQVRCTFFAVFGVWTDGQFTGKLTDEARMRRHTFSISLGHALSAITQLYQIRHAFNTPGRYKALTE